MRRAVQRVVLCAAVTALVACAHREPSPAGSAPLAAAAPAVAPPAGSPLAKVQIGMSEREVEDILGRPTDENSYVTGKAFVPFYFGKDSGRVAYFYKGVGRVVFTAGGPYSRSLRVQRVEYDPNEPGRAR